MIDKNYVPPKWLIQFAVTLVIQKVVMERIIDSLDYEIHKDCSLHCKYKRMIIKGELKE